jgi:hypothetical protein
MLRLSCGISAKFQPPLPQVSVSISIDQDDHDNPDSAYTFVPKAMPTTTEATAKGAQQKDRVGWQLCPRPQATDGLATRHVRVAKELGGAEPQCPRRRFGSKAFDHRARRWAQAESGNENHQGLYRQVGGLGLRLFSARYSIQPFLLKTSMNMAIRLLVNSATTRGNSTGDLIAASFWANSKANCMSACGISSSFA